MSPLEHSSISVSDYLSVTCSYLTFRAGCTKNKMRSIVVIAKSPVIRMSSYITKLIATYLIIVVGAMQFLLSRD